MKYQLKKVLCLGVAVGTVGMSDRELYVNIQVGARQARRGRRAKGGGCRQVAGLGRRAVRCTLMLTL